jgi:uncharacterized membrane protein YqjE
MSIEDRILAVLEDPERRANAFRWLWIVSMAFVFFGYGYIAWVLLF